jgi:hypothetical protein
VIGARELLARARATGISRKFIGVDFWKFRPFDAFKAVSSTKKAKAGGGGGGGGDAEDDGVGADAEDDD